MSCPRQGRNCEGCRDASRRALGITTGNPMESPVVRCVAVLLVVLAFCLVLQRLGVAFNWPL